MANITKLKRWYAVVDAKQRIQYIQEIIRTSDIKRFRPAEIDCTDTGYRYAIRDTRNAAVEAARRQTLPTLPGLTQPVAGGVRQKTRLQT